MKKVRIMVLVLVLFLNSTTSIFGSMEEKTQRVLEVHSHTDNYVGRELAIKFTDMEAHWSNNDVEDLLRLGIVEGFADETFRPDKKLQLDQFLKMVLDGWICKGRR
ncbi:MAG: S-layer homology domain-containing protein [Clostridiales bacterium]|nr:S-layer homology domain-containing protein [Clostridiales bacterium]